MKFKLLIALAAVFSLVAAACGDDDTADGGAADTAADSAAGGGTVDIDGILAADLGACAEAPAGDPIKVGMAMDFSDVVGFVDIPGSKLVPHVADLANCAGGVDGRPVEVRVAEVGDDAALAAQDLLDWGAHFIIGPPFADFALPILQVTEGNVCLLYTSDAADE